MTTKVSKVSKEHPVHFNTEGLPAFGTDAHTHISADVFGYWGQMISIYIKRDWKVPTEGPVPALSPWQVEISHAAGGRDKNVVPDDADAADAMGQAMIEAAKLARYISGKWQTMETVYRDTIENERQAAAQRVANDPPMGAETAERITQSITDTLLRSDPDTKLTVVVFDRGDQTVWHMSARRTKRQIRFKSRNGSDIKRSQFVHDLAHTSARGGIIRGA